MNQALPYEEFKLNPNTVMITTSLGGHLCWFETGGGRWHPKPVSPNIDKPQGIVQFLTSWQVCNFLNHLAFRVDLDSLTPSSESVVPERPSHGAAYKPMQRKLEIYGQ